MNLLKGLANPLLDLRQPVESKLMNSTRHCELLALREDLTIRKQLIHTKLSYYSISAADVFPESLNLILKGVVLFEPFFNLLGPVDHSGMILAAKSRSNFRIG